MSLARILFQGEERNHRRNLTKGQQAIALAMIYPEAEKGGRGNKKERVAETSTLFSSKRLQQARRIVAYDRKLADAVRDGLKRFDDALGIVEVLSGWNFC